VSTTTSTINKVGVVCIPVSDQDRALAFYVDVLGLEKRADVPFGNGYRWVEVAPAGGDARIAIVPPPEGKPTGNMETGIGLETQDIDAVHAALKERGADVDDEISRMGDPVPPLFWFRDPDGNTLMVVEAKRQLPWTKPEDISYVADKPLPELGGHHELGFLAAFGDGAVRFVALRIAEQTLRNLITRDDGNPIDAIPEP